MMGIKRGVFRKDLKNRKDARMRIMKCLIVFCIVFCASQAQAQTPTQAEAFTKSFYAWYTQEGKDRSVESVLLHKKEVLSPTLYKLLKEDRDAQAKVPGMIVGLDFDPFLNTQDAAQNYKVEKAIQKSTNYWVDVYALWNGVKSKKPALSAEVSCTNATCQFVNFHYVFDIPENRNVIQILKVLQKERKAGK